MGEELEVRLTERRKAMEEWRMELESWSQRGSWSLGAKEGVGGFEVGAGA